MAVSPKEVKSIIERNRTLESAKAPWLDLLQLIGQFIDTRRMDFSTSQQPGDFLNREIFDSVTPKAATVTASGLACSHASARTSAPKRQPAGFVALSSACMLRQARGLLTCPER